MQPEIVIVTVLVSISTQWVTAGGGEDWQLRLVWELHVWDPAGSLTGQADTAPGPWGALIKVKLGVSCAPLEPDDLGSNPSSITS